jgi:hypothetical protein
MTGEQLTKIVSDHGLAITSWHGGAGQFRDLYIGVGADGSTLLRLQETLASQGISSRFTHTSNPDHPDHGKPMLEIPSFWWD